MKKTILMTIIMTMLLLSLVSASPEPSTAFKIRNWFEQNIPTDSFSINSDYKSFTRWNPNLNSCKYYTGICDSTATTVVAASYCADRTGTKNEYKTITTSDQELLTKFNACGTNPTTPTVGDGKLGSVCETANDCGLVCQGKTNCEPRCLFNGEKRICISGDKTGVYTNSCVSNSDCESGESCKNGLCTTPSYDTGNPTGGVTEDQICTTVNCNTKCSDGTGVAQCSTKTVGAYCEPLDPKHETARLIPWSSICGCPEGQRADFGGRTCCTAPNCVNCQAGEYQTKICPVSGEEVITATCSATGYWTSQNAVCSDKDETNNFWLYAVIGLGTLTVIGLMGLLLYLALRKKR